MGWPYGWRELEGLVVVNMYERESVEFIRVTVTEDGVPVTEGIEVAVTSATSGARPTVWRNADVKDGHIGYLLDGSLNVGHYELWVRASSVPEFVVLWVGTFRVI